MTQINQQSKFDCQFYTNLNNLEQRFYLQESNKTDIEQLVLQIGELVMFYDLRKDPIKQYFIEKMQFILSRPLTLSHLKGKITVNPETTPMVVHHQHNFSLPVLKLEKQAQVQSDLNNSFEKIKKMQEEFEMQKEDQSRLVQRDIDNQMALLKTKIFSRRKHQHNQSAGQIPGFITSHTAFSDTILDDVSPDEQRMKKKLIV